MVLNLQQAGNPDTGTQLSTFSEPSFATNSFVGNLGAQLQVSRENMEFEEFELQEFDQEHGQNLEYVNELTLNTAAQA